MTVTSVTTHHPEPVMRAPRAVLGPVKRGVTDTPRREGSGEARVSHHPLACPRYFTHYTGVSR